MNWDNPAERLALIQRVGVAEYQRLLNQYGDEHRERTTVAAINGRSIWPVECKYGPRVRGPGFDRCVRHARRGDCARSHVAGGEAMQR